MPTTPHSLPRRRLLTGSASALAAAGLASFHQGALAQAASYPNKPVRMLRMWMKEGDVTDVPAFRDGIQPSPMASQFSHERPLRNVMISAISAA